ncbi:MAG: hypothetical protein JO112_21435 [Planctomycetes bacterium]|nr:hypothetical protein [Planctomycetota bacterium]
MRIERKAVAVAVALVAGAVVYLVARLGLFRGLATSAPLAFGLAGVYGMSFGLLITMTPNPVHTQEWVKQVAVWLGIVALLPLAVWYGTSVYRPPPEWKKYSQSESRLEEQIQETQDKAEKDKLRSERDRVRDKREEAERVFYHAMFWVAYPVGLLGVVVGTFFPVQAVGSGLMFGGLICLATGCYAYWDRMDSWLRFGSLVVALVVLLALGTWRFRPMPLHARTLVE